MIKRPILMMALFIIFSAAILYKALPSVFIPAIRFEDKAQIVLNGTVIKTQTRKDSVYLFLDKAAAYAADRSSDCADEINAGSAVLITDTDTFTRNRIKMGNTVSAKCTYHVFERARNWGNYDEEEFYYSLGVFLKAEGSDITVTDRKVNFILQAMHDIRKNMVDSIYESTSDQEAAGILAAICTGDRSGLTQETKLIYQKSGIAHILAVSGLHISLVGMSIFRILRKKLRFMISAAISASMVAGFCVMTGMSASGVRAAVMFAVQLTAIGLGKNYDILCSLSLAAVLLLVSNPLYIINSGFQLSVMAVFSAGFLYKPMLEFLAFRLNKDCPRIREAPGNTLRMKLVSGLLLSISVTIGTMPVTSSVYYEVPLYSIIINIIIIPLMSVTLGSGIISALSGIFSILAGRFFAGSAVYIVYFIKWFCRMIQSMPGSVIVTGSPSSWQIAAYYLTLIICKYAMEFCMRREMDKPDPGMRKRSLYKISFLVSVIMIALIILFLRVRSSDLSVEFIDVDQGECILIESPSGINYMIDSGSVSVKNVAQYRVASAVKYRGISRIDYMIVTHPDADHMNGVTELIQNKDMLNIRIDCLLIPYVPDNENYKSLVRIAEENGITVARLHRGMYIQDSSLEMYCLHPDIKYVSESVNGYSAVMELLFGDFSALFTGDIGEEEEKILPDRKRKYTLLKVAHHGSRFSSTAQFLEAVSPETAVISAGRNNMYGHPHQETLERLYDAGAMVFTTARSGEIIICTDGKGKTEIRTKL